VTCVRCGFCTVSFWNFPFFCEHNYLGKYICIFIYIVRTNTYMQFANDAHLVVSFGGVVLGFPFFF